MVPSCLPLDPNDYWRWTEHSARKMLADCGFEETEAVPILPTMSNLLHLSALGARKVLPVLGDAIATCLEVVARAGLRSHDYRLAGGYALAGVRPK